MYSTTEETIDTMQSIKNEMINSAILKSGLIFPTKNKKSIYDCFTEEIVEKNGELLYKAIIFWYNDIDHSTKVIIKKIF